MDMNMGSGSTGHLSDSDTAMLSTAPTTTTATTASTDYGRIKPKPKCVDEKLRRSSKSTQELAKFCFEGGDLSRQLQAHKAHGNSYISPTWKVTNPTTRASASSHQQTQAVMPLGSSSSVTVVSRSSDVTHNMVSSSSSTASNASTISNWELDHFGPGHSIIQNHGAAQGAYAPAPAATASMNPPAPAATATATTNTSQGAALIVSAASAGSNASVTVTGQALPNSAPSTPSRISNQQSERINQKVTARKESRNGRETQRWQIDATRNRKYRLVTGCVPIVEGGKILFVSASRKAEWILPKGGWEQDEAMEESAIRESFEEGGVLGILGPRLSEVVYETRKARKRRLEFEEMQKRRTKLATASTAANLRSAKPVSEVHTSNTQQSSSSMVLGGSTPKAARTAEVQGADASINVAQPTTPLSTSGSIALPTTPTVKKALFDDASSVASAETTSKYSHVKMTLFPLYVSEVKNEWPESGRLRTIVDIDKAIEMCENRPEFQEVLIEVKRRNLHLPRIEKI